MPVGGESLWRASGRTDGGRTRRRFPLRPAFASPLLLPPPHASRGSHTAQAPRARRERPREVVWVGAGTKGGRRARLASSHLAR